MKLQLSLSHQIKLLFSNSKCITKQYHNNNKKSPIQKVLIFVKSVQNCIL